MGTVAILDLGSNTFNLLIVKQYEEEYHTIFKTKIPAKLGADGFGQKTITPEAFKRGIVAIQALQMTIQQYRADQIYAFATSAMRDADNGSNFVREVADQTGIEINVISGDREAELIYNGVSRALEIGDKPELIMDIGGGSTEFIIASNEGIHWKHSFDLGVSRLHEHLKPADPLSTTDIKDFENLLDSHLPVLFEAIEEYDISGLIGSSGSFESLAKMIRLLSDESPLDGPAKLSGTTEYDFATQELNQLNDVLIKSTFDEREKMMGLVPYRVETIPLACMFINYIIEKFPIRKIRLSTYALREGVINELHENN